MKKTILLTFTVIAVLLTSNGCKKGKGDPFISLHSRDKRLMGEWTVSKIEWSKITTNVDNTINQSNYQNTTKTETTTFDGSSWTETVKNDYSGSPSPSTSSTTQTDTYSKTFTLTLDKHGVAKATETTSQKLTTTLASTPANTCGSWGSPGLTCDGTHTYSSATLTTTNTYEGTWNWASDNKDKEKVVIDLGNAEMTGTYMIEQLKNKEIVLKKSSVDGSAYSGTNNSSTNVTETGTYTLTGGK